MVRLLAGILLFTLTGCQSRAQQQPASPTPALRTEVNEAVSQSRQNAITRAVEHASQAVVSINVISINVIEVQSRDPFAGFFNDPFFSQFFSEQRTRRVEQEVQNLGSGFVISPDGYIVTNHHVAGNATKVTVSLASGRTLPARLVGSDKASDLALIKVDPDEPLPHLNFSSEPDPIVGEWAIALGNPLNLFQASEPTVTVGVVSGLRRDLGNHDGQLFYDMIQTDASINQGNSGGPLLNALGEVIGVNTVIVSQSGGSIGLGFAIPAARAQRIIEELRLNGRVDRAYYTGLKAVNLTDQIVAALRLETRQGILVVELDEDSPALHAGLSQYDVITAVEDEPIRDTDEYVARLYDFRPGDTITHDILREGQPLRLELNIGRLRN
ncbi:MAG: trypsin-like peptidase domain-containing protein [Bacteroidota bacterium]|nr:trypsin-like peptidase domain-containing protein [Bacteroidota bacterium]MDE2956133.1 trypsin-like peptidase domain-containing protein [Bacteroidota bacterium]